MKNMRPCLWFDNQAEEAVNFYVSIFKDAKIGDITRYDEQMSEVAGQPAGSVMLVEFQLEGNDFMALNGGPIFQFTPAISFEIDCKDQAEVDHYWDKLTEGGAEDPCGWLRDKYGVSWQVVPTRLNELLKDPDKAKAGRAAQAMLQMTKIDIAEIERVAAG